MQSVLWITDNLQAPSSIGSCTVQFFRNDKKALEHLKKNKNFDFGCVLYQGKLGESNATKIFKLLKNKVQCCFVTKFEGPVKDLKKFEKMVASSKGYVLFADSLDEVGTKLGLVEQPSAPVVSTSNDSNSKLSNTNTNSNNNRLSSTNTTADVPSPKSPRDISKSNLVSKKVFLYFHWLLFHFPKD